MRILIALLISVSMGSASNWYVRPSAAGSHTGADWNNAWALNSISWSSVKPGDTVYLAGGTYSGVLKPGANGSSGSPITIERAQASDGTASSAAGWSSSFDSTVKLSEIEIPNNSYVTIDGNVHGGISITLSGNGGGVCINGADQGPIDHITLANISCIGPYINGGTVNGGGEWGINLCNSAHPVTNVLIHDCSVVGMGESLRSAAWNGVIIEHCYFADTNGNSAEHEDVMYGYPSNNVTFRYNLINNSPNDGIFMEYGGAKNFSFYGNIYYNSDYWFICTKAGSGSTYGPMFIYNNVFVSQGAGGWVSSNNSNMNAGSKVYNNIFYNVTNEIGSASSDYNAYYNTSTKEAHGITFTTNPFVKMPGKPEPVGAVVSPWGSDGDFHLTAAAAKTFAIGMALTTDGFINKDLDGNTRTSWTIGAYQMGGGPGPTPTASASPTSTPTATASPTPIATPVAAFALQSSVTPTTQVNVRQAPSGTLIGTQPAGAVGVVYAGPKVANLNNIAVNWYQLQFPSGISGWVGSDFLVQAQGPPPPTPTPSPTATPTPTPTATTTPAQTFNKWNAALSAEEKTNPTADQLNAWWQSHPATAD